MTIVVPSYGRWVKSIKTTKIDLLKARSQAAVPAQAASSEGRGAVRSLTALQPPSFLTRKAADADDDEEGDEGEGAWTDSVATEEVLKKKVLSRVNLQFRVAWQQAEERAEELAKEAAELGQDPPEPVHEVGWSWRVP